MEGLNSVGPGSWQAMGCMGTQGSVQLDRPHTHVTKMGKICRTISIASFPRKMRRWAHRAPFPPDPT